MANRKFRRLSYAPKGMSLTAEQFHALHDKVDRTRSTSKTVTVPMQALVRLLNDHSLMWARLDEVEKHLRSPDAGKPTDLAEPVDGSELI